MADVIPLDTNYAPISSTPNDALIEGLEILLETARSGELQSFIGTGFRADGMRHTFWGDFHPSVFEMAGSLSVLHAEYIRRRDLDAL